MSKLNAFSYLFFFIAIIILVIVYFFEYILGSPNYFYTHFLEWTLLGIILFPIIGVMLGLSGEKGNLRLMAIALNTLFFIAFAPLALWKLWITFYGW
ncbi:hypothetical protein QWY14_02590 [Planococcus sp. N028]|uniref:Uncharacterized protein n=1 Tax=Planococcus shixiaomingii TaxID=3058393 RepID=A0ABT8MYD8_9BACL|nr:hypothetical protein [Planococcus sp. N028]MDN7240656.1 hypothetical protein [Planococcus sp. N028]